MNLSTALGSRDDTLVKVIIPLVNKYYILNDINGMECGQY